MRGGTGLSHWRPSKGKKSRRQDIANCEEFQKQTDYISIVFIHTESAHADALVLVSLHS